MRMGMALIVASAMCGCFAGDSTGGAENRSEWRIDDGLCPGIGGGCAMTVPVAAGVEVAVDSEIYCARPERDSSGRLVADCDIAAFDVRASGAAEVRAVDRDASDGRLDVRVFTTRPGQVTLELLRSGASFDRIGMQVRDAVDIECGRVGGGGASWDMLSLDANVPYDVELFGADSDPQVELGCRLVDADGLPLFSGSAIWWEIVEGADLATVDDGGLFGTDGSTGARVYVHVDRSGTIRLRASFGDLSREVELNAG